jgi:predicted methyltransferase
MTHRTMLRSLVIAMCGSLLAAPAALAADEAAESSLAAAVAGDWRPEADTSRDEWRHPVETLSFFGIDPSGAIAEVDPLGGYYARILIPWISANGGSYTAVVGDVDEENPELRAELDALAANAGGSIAVQYGELSADADGIAPPGALDAVVTFRNVHNWMPQGYADKAFRDFYAALKPGGVLGVVEHRLPEDSLLENTGRTGYVRQSHVIALAEAAGFVLEETSEINANPADDADHPVGVWTLRPTRASPREGTPEAASFDRAAYDAIGESDRMTLRFRKPAM